MRRLPGLMLMLVLAALGLGCSTGNSSASDGLGNSPRSAAELDVPEGVRGIILLPEPFDPWVIRQRERRLTYLMGTGRLYSRGDAGVLDEQIEFHVANRFFFEEGLGVDPGEVGPLVEALADEQGRLPFVLTTNHTVVSPGMRIAIPEGFDGWLAWLKPTGNNTRYTREVEVRTLRIRHREN
ncbi:MAG: hypothetical protein JJU36_14870 [Phycisphaeraceae bacterium]|nr:hypothetical protein [Phycisphaeraceae bacterium]